MIANVNEKGRQTKLLAAIAVLAMVICAFAVVMPTDNVEGAITPVDATGVTQYTEPVTSYANGDPLNYYVAASSEATDATFDLDEVEFSAATTINIYMQSSATISITTASSNLTVNLYTVSGTPTSGTASGTVNLKYYAETATAVANTTATAVTIDATDFGFSTGTAINITNNAKMVAFKPSTNDDTQYYNTAVVGNGMNSFELKTGGSLTIPARSTITGNFTVSNDDTSAETTEFTAANTIQFMVDTTTAGQADAFTVGTTEVSISDTSGALHINTATWITGTVVMSKGIAIVDAGSNMGTATGDLQTVSNGLVSGNVTLYASIEDAVSRNASNIYLYGDYANVNVTLNDTNVSVQPNGSLSGTFNYRNSSVAIDVETESGIPNVIQTASATGMTVNGNATGSGADVSVSDVTVNRVTGNITVSGVEFRKHER